MRIGATIGSLLVLALFATACAPVIVRNAVTADGRLMLNGQPADGWREGLAMNRASWTHGVVWLYVEGAGRAPGPTAAAQATANRVIGDVKRRHLMVALASRPDLKDLEAYPQFRRTP